MVLCRLSVGILLISFLKHNRAALEFSPKQHSVHFLSRHSLSLWKEEGERDALEALGRFTVME